MTSEKPINFVMTLTRNGRIWKRKKTNKNGEEVYDVTINGKKFHRGVCVKWFAILTGIHVAKGCSTRFNCYGKDDTSLFNRDGHWPEHIDYGDRG